LNDNIYNHNLDNRNFISLVATDAISSTIQFPIKWIAVENNEIIGLSRQEQKSAQQQLKAKQRFAKVFGFAKGMINKAIEVDLDRKLITMLESFYENEIKPNLESNNVTYTDSNEFNVANKTNIINSNEGNHLEYTDENKVSISSSEFDEERKRKVSVVENPILKRQKGRPPKAHRVF
ncbi:15396_t:CDS:1, partial [Racocetra fulgida]